MIMSTFSILSCNVFVESKIQNMIAALATPARELAMQHDVRDCGDGQGNAFASEFSLPFTQQLELDPAGAARSTPLRFS